MRAAPILCKVIAIDPADDDIVENIGSQGFLSLPSAGDRIHYQMSDRIDVVEVIRVDHYPVDYSNTDRRSNIFGNDQPAATVYCRFFGPTPGRTGTEG